MYEEKIKAIDHGIKKWIDLRKNRRFLSEGRQQCDLCTSYQHGPEICSRCPLMIVGFPCIEKGSTWYKYDVLVDKFVTWPNIYPMTNEHSKYCKDLSPALRWKIRPLINRMIHNLQATRRDLVQKEKRYREKCARNKNPQNQKERL